MRTPLTANLSLRKQYDSNELLQFIIRDTVLKMFLTICVYIFVLNYYIMNIFSKNIFPINDSSNTRFDESTRNENIGKLSYEDTAGNIYQYLFLKLALYFSLIY